jgi:O-antigen/teichoic acid export membrane protein
MSNGHPTRSKRWLAPLRARTARALAEDGKKSVWAFADQGVVSLGNFAVNILLARYLAEQGRLDEYGVFGFLFEIMLLVNGVHAALIVYPLTLRAANDDRATARRLMSACLALTFAALPVIGGVIGILAAILSADILVGVWAAAALFTWQAQETARKTLMAELRFRAALWGDAVSYVGQLICVVALAHNGRLSLLTTYQSMAVTSAIALALQAWQVGVVRVAFAEVKAVARDAWSLGRWVLWGNLSTLVFGALFASNFLFWAGKEMVGIAAGVNNLMRLANPLLIVMTSMIGPHAVRARATGMWNAARVSFRLAGLGALLLTPYIAALVIFPRQAIRLAYGPDEPYLAYAYVLSINATQAFVAYCAAMASAFLNAVEETRAAFKGQVTYLLVMAVVGMPLTALYHFPGISVGGLLATLLQLIVVGSAVRSVLRADVERAEATADSDVHVSTSFARTS